MFDGDRSYQTRGRAIWSDRYKYVVYHWGKNREQLFDLQADPGEMLNLAVDGRCRPILDDHRRRLADWCRLTSDPFIVPGIGPDAAAPTP